MSQRAGGAKPLAARRSTKVWHIAQDAKARRPASTLLRTLHRKHWGLCDATSQAPPRGAHPVRLVESGPVLVVGPGAIGTLVAVRLAAAGHRLQVTHKDTAV